MTKYDLNNERQKTKEGWKRAVKAKINKLSIETLNGEISNSKSLNNFYPLVEESKIQDYLTIPNFKGRMLITKARLNIFPLNKYTHWSERGPLCECCGEYDETLGHLLDAKMKKLPNLGITFGGMCRISSQQR